MISSANPAETGISRSWNNTYTISNNKPLYDANVDNFNDMLPDRTGTDYYHTASASPCEPAGSPAATCKMYYNPRAGSTPSSDTIYNILSDVTCTGASAGLRRQRQDRDQDRGLCLDFLAPSHSPEAHRAEGKRVATFR
jgi:hypothetical protein